MPENMPENKAKILIVDDEVIIASDLESRLKALGYTVCAKATSGEQALDLVEQHQPDLVMMDIVIQGEMDGIDAAEVIRDKWGIPVVFTTSYADPERLERAKLTYPFGYILKPFRDQDLKITLEMALYVAKVDGERKRAEKSLEEANTDLRLAQKIAKIGNWSFDPEVCIPEWSDHVYELYERSPHDGLPSLEDYNTIYTGEHSETFWSAFQAAINDGQPYDIKLLMNLPCGKSKWVHSICEPSPIKGPKGHILRGTIQDITAQKQAEEALREREEQLVEAMKLSQTGHWEYDVSSDTFTFNDNFYQMFRTTAEKVGGYRMSSADYAKRFCHPDDAQIVAEEVQAAIQTDDPNYYRQLEHRILFADGEVGYITVRFFIVKDSQGRTIKTFGVNQDITKRKQTEETLRESEQRLQAVFNSVDGRPDSGI